jgi:hypothetical protein
MEGTASAVEIPDEFIYVPFLESLEQILQNDDIRARVCYYYTVIPLVLRCVFFFTYTMHALEYR